MLLFMISIKDVLNLNLYDLDTTTKIMPEIGSTDANLSVKNYHKNGPYDMKHMTHMVQITNTVVKYIFRVQNVIDICFIFQVHVQVISTCCSLITKY